MHTTSDGIVSDVQNGTAEAWPAPSNLVGWNIFGLSSRLFAD